MTDVPFAASSNASADSTERHRTSELISWPELGELRAPTKALRNSDARPPLTRSGHTSQANPGVNRIAAARAWRDRRCGEGSVPVRGVAWPGLNSPIGWDAAKASSRGECRLRSRTIRSCGDVGNKQVTRELAEGS